MGFDDLVEHVCKGMDERDELEAECDELKEKLRIATEALEFYGDIKNWEVKTMSEGMLGETLIREVRQLEYNPGQRARAALERIK